MKQNILLFGVVRESAGAAVWSIELPGTCTVKDLRQLLEAQLPVLRTLGSYAIAVDHAFAGDDTLVNAASEIAIVPPVSGG